MPSRKGTRDHFRVKVIFEGEMAERFNAIKKAWGLENKAEVVRMLVSRKYEEISNKSSP